VNPLADVFNVFEVPLHLFLASILLKGHQFCMC
jgi:hypothetical protein